MTLVRRKANKYPVPQASNAEIVILASGIEQLPAYKRWQSRLVNLEVVLAERRSQGCWLFNDAWWHLEVKAPDGWSKISDSIQTINLVELDDFMNELEQAGWNMNSFDADDLLRALRRVLRPALKVADDKIFDWRMKHNSW
jgi:hypothetical protein